MLSSFEMCDLNLIDARFTFGIFASHLYYYILNKF